MAAFTATVDVAAPAAAVWDALVDWPSHGRWIPLTSVVVTSSSPAGVGARFVGRTGVGRLAFDDPMEVVGWQPPDADRPGRCEVVKQGRLVLGRAAFDVEPLGPLRSRVRWWEEVEVVPVRLTALLGPLVSRAAGFAFTRSLRVMGREVEARAAHR